MDETIKALDEAARVLVKALEEVSRIRQSLMPQPDPELEARRHFG